MDNTNFSEKIVTIIKETGTQPHSRWYFVVKNIAVWVLSLLCLILGALAISAIIFRFSNAGLFLFETNRFQTIKTALRLVPLVWTVALLLFGYLTLREIRQTTRGYQHKLSTLLAGIILGSIVLGIAGYMLGSGYILDKFADKHLPFHEGIEALMFSHWQQPDIGFLAGEILEHTDQTMTLEDLEHNLWNITLHENIPPISKTLLEHEIHVRVRGQQIGGESFIACFILPLEVRGYGIQQPRRRIPHHHPSERSLFPLRTNGCEGVQPREPITQ